MAAAEWPALRWKESTAQGVDLSHCGLSESDAGSKRAKCAVAIGEVGRQTPFCPRSAGTRNVGCALPLNYRLGRHCNEGINAQETVCVFDQSGRR